MAQYTPFSNYKEENEDKRKSAAELLPNFWGEKKEKYIEYRDSWNRAATDLNYIPEIPLNLTIDASSRCQLRCRGCGQSTESDLPDLGTSINEDVYKLIDEAAKIGIPSISFAHRGEPTLNKSLPAYIKYAKNRGILETRFVTNALSPHKWVLKECVKAGVDIIIISIDGFSRSSYETFRRGSNYHQLLLNVFQLLEFKQTHFIDNYNDKVSAHPKPFIRVQCVRNEYNKDEIEDFLKFWNKVHGVDDVRISDIMNREPAEDGMHKMFVGDQETVGRVPCPQPNQRLIFTNMVDKAFPCCHMWKNEYPLGTIKKQSIMEIWNGEPLKRLRAMLKDGSAYEKLDACKGCAAKESYTWSKREETS
jgi:MoaA/NifB/PqqE/SkfB family radical SAM enzyme